MSRRSIAFIISVFAACIAGFAQSEIKVEAPNLVAGDEQFRVTFVVEGENAPSDFSWSAGQDFQVVWGPQRGSSTSISIVQGKRSKSSQTTYTYILLPKGVGKFTLPAATATVKGTSISSKSVTVEVVADGGNASGQQQRQGGGGNNSGGSERAVSPSGNISSDDLFLRLTLSGTSAVIGQPITVTLKLYQRVNVAGFEDARFPTFDGFWSQETEAPTHIQFHRENIDDKIYNAATLRSWVIIPQQAGSLRIDPAELVCLVNVRSSSGGNSIFDSFFDDYVTLRKRLTTSPVTVNVSRLPAGVPASFGGGVGVFRISAKLSVDSLRTHEAASLTVTVSGKGNVSLLTAPTVAFPPDFEVYDTKSSDNTSAGDGRTSGSKTFEYPFIPRSHGSFEIPAVEYSYYDIKAGRYVTLTTEPLTVNVARGDEPDASAAPGQVAAGTVQKRDVRSIDNDIRYVATKVPTFREKGASFYGSGLFWGLTALLLMAGVAAAFALRKVAAMRADVAGTRNRKASKMARGRLRQAGDFLAKNLYTAFYEELHKALTGYVSDKLNMDMSDMSKENIASELGSRGVPEAVVEDFTGLLDACEFARYSPDAGHEAMNAHYEVAVQAIAAIDSSMKAKKTVSGGGGTGAAILALLLAVLPASLGAQQRDYLDSLWKVGVEAYSAGDWAGAASAWEGIAAAGVESAQLSYNIGNACYRLQDYARAILNYERALKADPSYDDARHNLEVAEGMVQDKIEDIPEVILVRMWRAVGRLMGTDAWAVAFLLLLAGAILCGLVFMLSGRRGVRKAGFFSAVALLVLALLSLNFARASKSSHDRADSAVVMRPVVSVKSSPSSDSSSKDLFVLHEGTKVRILDEVGTWKNIELSDGRQGWMQSSDIEII